MKCNMRPLCLFLITYSLFIVHFEFIIFKHLFIVWVLNIYVGRLLKFYDLISDYLCQQS
jgi:hypothetical protein